jgi:hypothetical protein
MEPIFEERGKNKPDYVDVFCDTVAGNYGTVIFAVLIARIGLTVLCAKKNASTRRACTAFHKLLSVLFIPSYSKPHYIQLPENSVSNQIFPSIGEGLPNFFYNYFVIIISFYLSYWNKCIKHFKQCKNLRILLSSPVFLN